MLVERFPCALQQQSVTSGQNRATRPQILTTTLHREDHQISTRRDHPSKDVLPNEVRSWRDYHFGEAGALVEQRICRGCVGILHTWREMPIGGEYADGRCITAHDQKVTL